MVLKIKNMSKTNDLIHAHQSIFDLQVFDEGVAIADFALAGQMKNEIMTAEWRFVYFFTWCQVLKPNPSINFRTVLSNHLCQFGELMAGEIPVFFKNMRFKKEYILMWLP
jgi:hypothetical protein